MNRLQEEIKSAWEQANTLWETFSTYLKDVRDERKSSFSLEAEEKQTGISFVDIARKFAECNDYINSITNASEADAAPARALKRINALINESIVTLEDPINKTQGFADAGGVKMIDNETLTISSNDDVIRIDVAAIFRTLFEKLDNVIYEFSIISYFFKTNDEGSFHSRRRQVDRIVANTEKEAQKVKVTREQLSETNKVLQTLIRQVNENLNEITGVRKKVEDASDTIHEKYTELDERSQEGDTQLEAISKLIEKATALRAEVDSYNTFLSDYKTNLSNTSERVSELESQLTNNLDTHSVHDAEIKRLRDDAEGMLTGATVVGLASHFEKIRNDLDKKLTGARWAVYCSVLLLFLSVMPIFLYAIAPWVTWNDDVAARVAQYANGDFVHSIMSLGMRSVLLVPAIWFATFAARRHDKLFRLKEHYAYKYSLASAVEGFKKQAPSYEDDIAAETFFQLTFNPTDKLDRKKDPNQRSSQSDKRKSLVMEAIKQRLTPNQDPKVDE